MRIASGPRNKEPSAPVEKGTRHASLLYQPVGAVGWKGGGPRELLPLAWQPDARSVAPALYLGGGDFAGFHSQSGARGVIR
jgi:hypothetical protein